MTPVYTIHRQQALGQPPTVVLVGELDLASKPELQTCFEGILATGAPVVNVELAEVSFIDASALGVLIEAFRQLRDRDGRLVITTASRFVLRVLEIAGLRPYFPVTPTDGTTRPG